MKTVLKVLVEYYDGLEEGDVGHPYYVASCEDLHFVTDGETFEVLLANIRECLELTLFDANVETDYGVAANAKVQLVMDLPEYA